MKPVRALRPVYRSLASPIGPAAKEIANTLAPALNTTASFAATVKNLDPYRTCQLGWTLIFGALSPADQTTLEGAFWTRNGGICKMGG
jgi:hypothetical protein